MRQANNMQWAKTCPTPGLLARFSLLACFTIVLMGSRCASLADLAYWP